MWMGTFAGENSIRPGRRRRNGGRRRRLIFLAAVSVFYLGGCASGTGTGSDSVSGAVSTGATGANPLRLRVVPGTVHVYRFEQDEETREFRQPGSKEEPGAIVTKIRAKLIRTCVSSEDGILEFVDKFEDVDVSVKCGGRLAGTEDVVRAERIKDFQKVGTSRFDDRFRQVGADGKPEEGTGAQAYFPEGALEPGATWGGEVPDVTNLKDPAAELQGLMPKITFRFAGVDRIGKWEAVRIDAESSGSETMSLDGPATSWFEKSTGALVRFSAMFRVSFRQQMSIRTFMDLQEVR